MQPCDHLLYGQQQLTCHITANYERFPPMTALCIESDDILFNSWQFCESKAHNQCCGRIEGLQRKDKIGTQDCVRIHLN